jgi:hypothetical protein
VKHVVDPLHAAFRDIQLREIAFDELDLRQMQQVGAFSGDEAIDDPHPFAASDQFLTEMRADEARAARHKIVSHSIVSRLNEEPSTD